MWTTFAQEHDHPGRELEEPSSGAVEGKLERPADGLPNPTGANYQTSRARPSRTAPINRHGKKNPEFSRITIRGGGLHPSVRPHAR